MRFIKKELSLKIERVFENLSKIFHGILLIEVVRGVCPKDLGKRQLA